MTPREQLIEALADVISRPLDENEWSRRNRYHQAEVNLQVVLAHRDLLLAALGGERRGTEDQVTEWAEDDMGWRSLPVTIQRYDAWRFPVSEEAQ